MNNLELILAPFGLEGAVTGREYGESDPRAARLLDAWRHIYPLEQNCSALEVICGGVRMLYPAPYVLFTEMEEPRPDAGGARAPHQASHLMAERAVRAAAHPPVSVPTIITTANTAAGPGTGRHNQSTELCNGDVSDKADFDFLDPTRKALCTCAK
ncbi:Mediator of RNA polymerase II transcription subunit 13-like [Eumeta japonica]|uniref:Mediator of RNA polymerase II transcription subunit 13-like n=1 Tax=Eumeta variegata TaxID=151549 RepID=A0A4C1TSY7_EUMVA|nr:Mediator of RNA polymerase II transcription subunit 13-like [Eumeta japonica]